MFSSCCFYLQVKACSLTNSAIHNPNVGPEATAKAEERLEEMQIGSEEKDKNPKNVAAGLKG